MGENHAPWSAYRYAHGSPISVEVTNGDRTENFILNWHVGQGSTYFTEIAGHPVEVRLEKWVGWMVHPPMFKYTKLGTYKLLGKGKRLKTAILRAWKCIEPGP